LAHAAAAELLTWLEFTNVVRGQDETVTSSTPDTVPGFILTRLADLYGRCIAVVLNEARHRRTTGRRSSSTSTR